jgi:hypothetical protein
MEIDAPSLACQAEYSHIQALQLDGATGNASEAAELWQPTVIVAHPAERGHPLMWPCIRANRLNPHHTFHLVQP